MPPTHDAPDNPRWHEAPGTDTGTGSKRVSWVVFGLSSYAQLCALFVDTVAFAWSSCERNKNAVVKRPWLDRRSEEPECESWCRRAVAHYWSSCCVETWVVSFVLRCLVTFRRDATGRWSRLSEVCVLGIKRNRKHLSFIHTAKA